ncbi:MAG: hypothetical protein WD971_00760 [Pirellulales bacterium]
MAKLRFSFASSGAADLLVHYIPSHDRDKQPIDQDKWVTKALDFLGRTFHGATAFPKARGVWRDDEQGGRLIFDEPVIVQCYTKLKLLESKSDELGEFLMEMGRETRQGAVGFVINREFFEIPFPLEE